MKSIFEDCSSLTSIDITKFSTENIINILEMFSDFKSLTSIDMTKFNTKNIINMGFICLVIVVL